MSLSGGTISTTFTYDPNGNQTSGLGRNITYSSYNKPSSITQGTQTISFLDDTEHQRFQQVTPSGTTLYIAGFGVLAELSGAGTTAAKWTDYLAVGNAKVGMRVLQTASETLSTRYFHTDHLGSVSVITDENGNVLERLSYDAWGKRRFPNGSDDPSNSITSQTTRGFTGQEELQTANLVHLNGRVYDSLLARFTSADPTVTDPTNPQGWNRYSYVGNDPLAFTDPNGFSWLSGFFNSIGKFFSGIGNFIKNNAIVRALVQIGITAILTPVLGPLAAAAGLATFAAGAAGAAAAFIGSAVVTGISGGNLSQSLRAGLIAGATVFAFAGIGPAPSFASNPIGFGTTVGASALVGCASAAASGGSCASGALSGAVGSALSPLTNQVFPNASSDLGQRIGGTLIQATVGGLASVAGGGKFANGAITGAFQYLATTSLEDARRNPLDASSKAANDVADSLSGPQLNSSSQPSGNPMDAYNMDAANDNKTPRDICAQALNACLAGARVLTPSETDGLPDYRDFVTGCRDASDLCYSKADRGIFSKGGDIIQYPDGGTVIFRPQYQLYVPSSNRPPNFLK